MKKYGQTTVDLKKIRYVKNTRVNTKPDAGLLTSMQQRGLLNPLTVKPSEKDGYYDLVAGHRRYYAAQTLDWKTVPVSIVSPSDDIESDLMTIDENLHRRDLSAIEMKLAINGLVERGLSKSEIAATLGKSTDFVRQFTKASKGLSDKQLSEISFGNQKRKKGKATVNIVNKALTTAKNYRLTDAQTESFIDGVVNGRIKELQIPTVALAVRSGKIIEEAIKGLDSQKSFMVPCTIPTNLVKAMKAKGVTNVAKFISKKITESVSEWVSDL